MGSNVSSVPRPRAPSARVHRGEGAGAATAQSAGEATDEDVHYADMLNLLEMEEDFWRRRASSVKVGYLLEQKRLREARSVFVSAQGVSSQSDERDEALRMGADQLYKSLTAKHVEDDLGSGSDAEGSDADASMAQDHNDTTIPQRMRDGETAVLDTLPTPPPPPPTPAQDVPMDSIPAAHYASKMAPLGLRPSTLPASKPLHLHIPSAVVRAYPPKPSIGLSEGDFDMALVVDRLCVPDILGGIALLRALTKEFVSRLSASGCKCPGMCDPDAATELFFNWITARLGGDPASPMHALSSFAQIAMLHSHSSITASRADLWLECMLGSMAAVLPHYSQSDAINWAHMALHQLFHLLAKGVVNDVLAK
eukprot:TRINITY_DN6493_c0_g1_i1.p1 TRINITY_DN6493_c0_g1~~TRINITY_DN6493_c0_g1_i1.p1  ORF type:complete len:367 (+),score=93.18 TRINITY_DN6493_c0_g1_i1:142-1242(+)